MYASMLPFAAASKHSKGPMIWPPGNTSIRNRPPLTSSTIWASRWAEPCIMSREAGQAVDMRHWTFGCAMTLGAPTMAAAAAAARLPPAVTMKRRRSLVTALSSPRHELVVCALGHAVPRADEGLELRVRGVDLPGHGGLL